MIDFAAHVAFRVSRGLVALGVATLAVACGSNNGSNAQGGGGGTAGSSASAAGGSAGSLPSDGGGAAGGGGTGGGLFEASNDYGADNPNLVYSGRIDFTDSA